MFNLHYCWASAGIGCSGERDAYHEDGIDAPKEANMHRGVVAKWTELRMSQDALEFARKTSESVASSYG